MKQQRISRSVVAIAGALALTLTSCSGSADTDGQTSGSTSAPPEEAATGLILTGLTELPDDAGWQRVSVGDLAGAADAVGLEISAEDQQWRSAVVFGMPLEDTPAEGLTHAPALVVLPQLIETGLQSTDTELTQTLGWSLFDIESLATLTGGVTGTEEFVVVNGDFSAGALTGLTDLGDGIWSLGAGEDGAFTFDSPSRVLDHIGRPVRLAQDGEQIALSTQTDAVRAWASTGPSATAADRPELAEPAAALDAAGALSALFVPVQRFNPALRVLGAPASPEQVRAFLERWQERLISQPFSSIAVGHSVEDGAATATIAYRFGSAQDAEAAAPTIESLLQGETFAGSPIDEAFVVETVTIDGNLVVATGTPPPDTSWTVLSQMILSGEPPFILG